MEAQLTVDVRHRETCVVTHLGFCNTWRQLNFSAHLWHATRLTRTCCQNNPQRAPFSSLVRSYFISYAHIFSFSSFLPLTVSLRLYFSVFLLSSSSSTHISSARSYWLKFFLCWSLHSYFSFLLSRSDSFSSSLSPFLLPFPLSLTHYFFLHFSLFHLHLFAIFFPLVFSFYFTFSVCLLIFFLSLFFLQQLIPSYSLFSYYFFPCLSFICLSPLSIISSRLWFVVIMYNYLGFIWRRSQLTRMVRRPVSKELVTMWKEAVTVWFEVPTRKKRRNPRKFSRARGETKASN
jgi:hypothetical protein